MQRNQAKKPLKDLEKILITLATQRPIFHSEADFQHALAWLIHQKYPNAKIRLEYPCTGNKGRIYLDILIEIGGIRIGIELKYKTKLLESMVDGEAYKLKNQSAQDVARYDLMSDLMRLEGLKESQYLDHGFAIFLTNDAGYWKDSGRRGRMDEDFRIHEGRSFSGNLIWADHTSKGTMKSREDGIYLTDNYLCNWASYSKISNVSFRYLFFPVK